MELSANELRIGNYVEYLIFDEIDEPKEYWSVSTIDANDIVCIDSEANENYRPISISKEWLLSFGYERINNHFYIRGHAVWICNDMFVCDKNGVVLNYVHELQNLYFSLTKNELIR